LIGLRQHRHRGVRSADNEETLSQLPVSVEGIAQSSGALVVGNDPKHPRGDTVAGLLDPGAVIALISAALAQQGRQMFGASIDLDEESPFKVTDPERHEKIRPQRQASAHPGHSSPAGGLGLDSEDFAAPLPFGHSEVDL